MVTPNYFGSISKIELKTSTKVFFSPSVCCRIQKTISLPDLSRGCHVVTRHIIQQIPELKTFEVGLVNIFSEFCFPPTTVAF
jgi:hypothetical protein